MPSHSKSIVDLYATEVFFALKNLYTWTDLWCEEAQYFHIDLVDYIKSCQIGSKYNFYQSPWSCSLRLRSGEAGNFRQIPRIYVSSEHQDPDSNHLEQYEIANRTLTTIHSQYSQYYKRSLPAIEWDYTVPKNLIKSNLERRSQNAPLWDISFLNDIFETKKSYWMDFLSRVDHVRLLMNHSTLTDVNISMLVKKTLEGLISHESTLNSYRYERVCFTHSLMLYLESAFPAFPSIRQSLSPLDHKILYGSPEINILLSCQYGFESFLPVTLNGSILHKMSSLLGHDFLLNIAFDNFFEELQYVSPASAMVTLVFILEDPSNLYIDNVKSLLAKNSTLRTNINELQREYHVLSTLLCPLERMDMLFELAQNFPNRSLPKDAIEFSM